MNESERERAKERGALLKRENKISDVSRRRTMWWSRAWWIRVEDGPNLRTAKERRRAWRAATRAAEGIHSEEWTEEVQRRSHDETSCWSKDLLKTRIFLKEDVSEEAEMFAQQGMRQNSGEQDAPVAKSSRKCSNIRSSSNRDTLNACSNHSNSNHGSKSKDHCNRQLQGHGFQTNQCRATRQSHLRDCRESIVDGVS